MVKFDIILQQPLSTIVTKVEDPLLIRLLYESGMPEARRDLIHNPRDGILFFTVPKRPNNQS